MTGLPSSWARLDKLDRRLGNLDGAIDAAEWQLLERRHDALPVSRARLDTALPGLTHKTRGECC